MKLTSHYSCCVRSKTLTLPTRLGKGMPNCFGYQKMGTIEPCQLLPSTMVSLGSHQQCRYQAPPASRCVRQHLSSCSLCGNMRVFFHSGPCTDDAPAQKRIRTFTPSPFLLPNFNLQCSSGSESWNSAPFLSLSSPATWKLGAELRASDHCIQLMTWPNTSLCFL